VNQLVDRFFEARKMMSQMGGMGLPGMKRGSATKSSKNSRKAKKGRGGSSRGPTPPRLPAGFGGAGGPGGGFGGGIPPQLPPGMTMPDLLQAQTSQAVARACSTSTPATRWASSSPPSVVPCPTPASVRTRSLWSARVATVAASLTLFPHGYWFAGALGVGALACFDLLDGAVARAN